MKRIFLNQKQKELKEILVNKKNVFLKQKSIMIMMISNIKE